MAEEKIAVITGASDGVGRETALLFARAGYAVVLLARNKDKLHRVANLIAEMRHKADVCPVDIGQADQVHNVFTAILARYGRIDVLINCAGFGKFEFADQTDGPVTEAMFRVNVLGLIACIREVLPSMIRQKAGHIVNVASIAGKLATPKSSVYAATKSAVIGYSNGLRLEVASKGITVTVVNPGPIRTSFFAIADPAGTYRANVDRFMITPRYVAKKIFQAVVKGKREVNLPPYMGFGAKLYQLFPAAFEKIGGHWLRMK
ncbi:MAG: SDR family oxidoreductase [Sporolactobacillus sp.]|jgi:short-subunit dehydrogenase|nr:SDR family oxidoreductase [Sporolactobacillus sp.]